MKQSMRKIVCLLFLALSLIGIQTPVHAEQLDNVKNWIEPEGKEAKVVKDEKEGSGEEQKQTPEPVVENSQIGVTAWDFMKMIIATIFVVALLYFVLKFINKKSKVYKSSQLVENMGGASLGQNRSVQMIKVGDRLLVVGVGENIQLLKEIEDEQERQQIFQEYNDQLDQLLQPSDIVSKLVTKVKSKQQPEKEVKNPFQQVLTDRLEKITKERKKVLDDIEKKGPDKQ
ncbi:flagellar biosynthetic protein FliO [Cytobacillus purgationiresistens]|uniref:Flagellar protein FliO/FliZ n=1 Tax=Cytobacillus purgationiresistens TaxID=863449 RepID=A0ABU0AHF7_9BACI|nr:flagellar biosynthetic protein FliO [Cytobacillus purgationiresistens]MDQ0270217.1 flagellar protein FliO/FliZ [Cytobacillus purgationiresistens]